LVGLWLHSFMVGYAGLKGTQLIKGESLWHFSGPLQAEEGTVAH
jgi:hypothetical protein